MATFLSTERFHRHGARTLPGEYFTSAERFAQERERIFSRHWLCVGRDDELRASGDFHRIEIAGEQLLMVRGTDGETRALYNVCRHRGSRVCEARQGRLSPSIQCPYHAWTYALDGRLLGAPHMKEVEGFDRADWGLHTARTETWQGFRFANLSDDAPPLATALEPMTRRIERFAPSGLRAASRIEYDVRANWKLIVQNYSECQHCPIIHPALDRLTPYDTGANDLTEGPFLGGYMVLTREGGSMTSSGRSCGVPVASLPPEDMQRVYYYTVFPGLLLSLHPDYLMYHMLWPVAPDRTRVVCEWLFHPDSLERGDCNPTDAISFWDETNRQDWHICELTQQGVSSCKYSPGPYSPRESLLAAWDDEYRRQTGPTGE